MPVFTYKGKNRTGNSVSGERTAGSKTELKATLSREQINVSKVSEKGKEFNVPVFGTGVGRKEFGCIHASILRRSRSMQVCRWYSV